MQPQAILSVPIRFHGVHSWLERHADAVFERLVDGLPLDGWWDLGDAVRVMGWPDIASSRTKVSAVLTAASNGTAGLLERRGHKMRFAVPQRSAAVVYRDEDDGFDESGFVVEVYDRTGMIMDETAPYATREEAEAWQRSTFPSYTRAWS